MKKVLIIDHYNLNNGDKAVLKSTLALLNNTENDLKICVSAFEPCKIDDNNNEYIPWGFLPKSIIEKIIFKFIIKTRLLKYIRYFYKSIINKSYLNAVKAADYIFISGGHHLTDILGDELFYILAINMLVPIYMNKKVYLLSQTIGDIKRPCELKDIFLRDILYGASKVAVRDNNSILFLKKMNYDMNNVQLIPDMVFGLYNSEVYNEKTQSIKKIGIALYGNYAGSNAKERINRYLNILCKAIEDLCVSGFEINLLPMEEKGTVKDDRVLANDIINKLPLSYRSKVNIMEPKSNDILDTIDNFAKQDIIIGYKTHSVIFSLLKNIPVLAIAYHQKTIDFMKEFGLEKYAFMDDEVTANKIIESINDIINNYDEIRMIENKLSKIKFKNVKSFIEEILEV